MQKWRACALVSNPPLERQATDRLQLQPPAVRAEVLSEAAFAQVQAAISQGWLSEQPPLEIGSRRLLNETLDIGESEAITLAQPMTPRWIILDDWATRRAAEGLGVPSLARWAFGCWPRTPATWRASSRC